jgi:hypothetical protein
MKLARAIGATIACALVLTLAPRIASPAPPDAAVADPQRKPEALRHFRIGLELVERKQWDAALAEFSRSRELFPTATAIENAAVCLRELGRFDEALDAYDDLLRSFAATLTPAERKAVDADVARIATSVGSLRVEADQPGATVVVDGRARGTTPLAPVRVSAGTRVYRVYKEGYAPREGEVRVEGGAVASVRVELIVVARGGVVEVREVAGRVFEVLVDGAVAGLTPWRGTLAAGEHTVALRGDGGFGAAARPLSVTAGARAEIVLEAVRLPGELRIEATPTDARVYIDGREVARGTWSGTLPSGPHVVDVASAWYEPQRFEVEISSDAPRSLRPALMRIRRAYLEGFLGTAFGVHARSSVGGCEGTCLGNPGGLRAGWMVAPRVGLEVFAFAFVAPRRATRSLDVATVFPDGSRIVTHTDAYQEDSSFGGQFFGVSAHYRFFDRTPLTVRLFSGIGHLNTTVSSESDVPGAAKSVSGQGWTPLFGPELRFGYRFGRAVAFDVGVGMLFLMVPALRAEMRPDVSVILPDGPSFSRGLGWFFPATLALRLDL